jgi:hypothetical protein
MPTKFCEERDVMKKENIFSNYSVRIIPKKLAKEYIIKNHYSNTFPVSCINLGAFYNDELIGVITFGLSAQPKMAQSIISFLGQHDYYELQRLHVMDCTDKNFESWFIAKAICWLKENKPNIKMLVSFSDPFYGHQGTVYQATNWLYMGKTSPVYVYVKETGEIVHNRTIQKGKVDVSNLRKEKRPPKNKYVLFLTKGIDVYKSVNDDKIIRKENLQYWINKENTDGIEYIERTNNFYKKYKINLLNEIKAHHKIMDYPKK